MTKLITILAGVISSLLAVFLVESYLIVKRKIHRRRLKKVLSFHGQVCHIIAPIYHQELKNGLIHYRDAYAFSHLFELCHRLNVEGKLIPFHKISDVAEADDLIVVGGPLSNKITSNYLRKYCPGFQLIYEKEASEFKELPAAANVRYVTGFRCGKHVLMANDDEEYGILVKITEKELDQERTVHIVFGYSGIGTGAAAYFLWKYYGKLFKKFGENKYFIAMKVSRHESYKSISATYIDLTSDAFEESG
ncbi:MAG TPA: hypothetical protein ENG63_07630 [Candidatus Desulfofervidus auxilii]|uniref:S-layer protein C-terminal domain-containing protein n=1 Tax=Desulfofervidus auxilii TaxID=1621989 RepID=A0A7C0YAQ1_DESA2|nr:MAG: hypothetical protein DRN73_08880 [Candidatus Pacearchaeota archaeon]HDD44712.1 hypothetical protein [Candidatus Desulfofervidus auxilii]